MQRKHQKVLARFFNLIVLLVFIFITLSAFSACSNPNNLSGTWTDPTGLYVPYTFSKDKYRQGGTEWAGNYHISNNNIRFFGISNGVMRTTDYSFSRNGNTIIINGNTYHKR